MLLSTLSYFQTPEKILQRRLKSKHNKTVPQVLIKWSHSSVADATWEDMAALQQRFPHSPAWGQAGFEDWGNVSSQGGKSPVEEGVEAQVNSEGRPKREKNKPTWMTGDDWLV